MANTYLSRNSWGTPTSEKKFTISLWFKICDAPNDESIIFNSYTGSTNRLSFSIDNSRKLKIENNNGSYNLRFITNRVIRDPNAFYHVVCKVDTTQGTESERFKMYVNGVQESSFNTATYPSQNDDIKIPKSGKTLYIGSWTTSGQHWNGIMSHFHFTDGYAYDASSFGSTDSTTGEWKINTLPSVSYGTNGFFILKDGNSVTDSSSNSNAFTVGGGTLTKTEDCPSNVFCTMNPLDKSSSLNLNYGNLRTASPSNNWMPCKATIGMLGQNGKFYWEGKCQSGTHHYFGVYDASGTVRGSSQSEMDSNRFVYVYAGGMERTITGQSAINSGTYATFANNDIIGVGLDKENGTITFWKNGTQIYTETHSSLQTKDLIPGTQAYGSDILWNFGNGYFGTTAVSSAGTNASGNGIFEYNVPAGYTALSTKGLNL